MELSSGFTSEDRDNFFFYLFNFSFLFVSLLFNLFVCLSLCLFVCLREFYSGVYRESPAWTKLLLVSTGRQYLTNRCLWGISRVIQIRLSNLVSIPQEMTVFWKQVPIGDLPSNQIRLSNRVSIPREMPTVFYKQVPIGDLPSNQIRLSIRFSIPREMSTVFYKQVPIGDLPSNQIRLSIRFSIPWEIPYRHLFVKHCRHLSCSNQTKPKWHTGPRQKDRSCLTTREIP